MALLYSCTTKVDHEIIIPPHIDEAIDSVIWDKYISGSLKIIKDSLWKDKNGHSYFVEGARIFILNNHSYFLGELINKRLNHNGDICPVSFSCIYNPISCSTFLNGEIYSFESIKPSQEETKIIIQDIMNKVFVNSNTYTLTKSRYRSKKELYLKYIHLGISMDSLTSGYRYYQKEMEHKYGYEISVLSELASIDIDIPDKLLQNKITSEDSLLYRPKIISSIHLGVFKSIIIESDDILDDVIAKILRNEELSYNESMLMKFSDIYYIHSSGKGIESEYGDYHIVKKIVETEKNDIIPLYISLVDYCNEGDLYFTHVLHIPN